MGLIETAKMHVTLEDRRQRKSSCEEFNFKKDVERDSVQTEIGPWFAFTLVANPVESDPPTWLRF